MRDNIQEPNQPTMNKEQGNKMIAEFMEWTIEPGMEKESNPYYNQPYKVGYLPQMILLSELKFNSSWDWLMPVVDKIESIDSCTYEVMLKYAIAFVCDKGLHSSPPVVRAIGSTRIETAYNLVVQFIQWYNQQTPTP